MENDSGQASSRRRPRRPPSSPHDSVLLQLPSHTSRPTREQSPRDVDLSRGSDGRARQSVSIPAPAGPLPSAARELDQILRKRALGNKPDSEFNNFFTPDNDFFCAQRPYKPLNPNRNEIRLLRVFPPRSYQEHAKSHPHWEHTLTPGAHGYMVRNFRDFGMSSPDTPVLCLELTDKVPISRISGGYCTISYCAGSPSDTSVVIVDGLPFMAFANLEHAIRNALGSWQTRHPGKALLIWADQICINQQDHTERALQVAMMQDVYRRCDETFVCLSTPGSPNHLSWATTLNAPTGPLANLSSYFGKLVERELDHFAPGVLETPQSQLDPGGGLIHAFLALMECKWWRRSWVFQEFISSPRPIFMSQATSLSWKHLDAALQFLLSPRFTEMVRTKVTESEAKLVVLVKKQVEAAAEQRERQLQALSAWERRKAGLKKWHADLLGQYNQLHSAMPPMIDIKRRTNRYVDLKPLLEHSRYCQATDPRDRVYAFIGLLPRDSYNITPDYRRANTIVHVLLDTARAIIEYEDGLGILRHVYRGRDNLGTLLPTWVPDWTSTKVDDHLSALISSMSESAPHTPKAASSPNQGRHCEDHHISRFEFRKSDEDDDTQIALGVSGFKIGRLEEGEEEGSVQLPGLQLWVFYQTEPWKARLDAETRALTLGMALPD
ncbi:heterokaryon incompatibility protein-domain-containing protein, partial [Podospora aff. communis PSN243]